VNFLKGIILFLLLPVSVTNMQAQGVQQLLSSCGDSLILKIGLIADPQYCDCDDRGTRIYREVLKKLPVAIDSMNKFQVDFVMNLGDMIDRYYESYDTIDKIYRNLTMPYYNLLGNHDFEEIHDSLKSTIISRYGMPHYYYGFTYKNWRFLVLDGTELAAYSRSLHPDLAGEGDSLFQQAQDKVNRLPWNGGIGREQRGWIRNQIQSAYDAKQNVILFCHFPVYPDSVDLNLWNSEEIIALIEDYPNVVAYINGHFHAGNYGLKKGIHYITQAAMLDTYDNNSFTLLEVFTGKLVFRGFGFNPDTILSYKDHFKVPFRIYLTDTIIHPTYHADSYIGSFSSSSGSGINYSLYNDSVNYKNNYFFISHDSLFVKTNMDLSVFEEITIKVLAITCLFDTVSEVFRLKYNTPILDVTRLQDEALLKLYPNPLSGTLHIDLNQPIIAEPVELIITDMNGRVMKIIQHYSVNPFTGIIEVTINADIPVGIYLVKISRPSQKDVFGKLIIGE
jgi:manganese-dependent ADP-ribose/CDP-alcohol diphosphatase